MRQIENLVHNIPTVIKKRYSDLHLSQLNTIHCHNDNHQNCITLRIGEVGEKPEK